MPHEWAQVQTRANTGLYIFIFTFTFTYTFTFVIKCIFAYLRATKWDISTMAMGMWWQLKSTWESFQHLLFVQHSISGLNLGLRCTQAKLCFLFCHSPFICVVAIAALSDVPFISSREEIKNIWEFSRKISREVKIIGNIGNLWKFLKLIKMEQIFKF